MVIQSTKTSKIKDHAPHTNSLKTSIIKRGFPADLSTSKGAKLCEFYPTTVLVPSKSAKTHYALQVDKWTEEPENASLFSCQDDLPKGSFGLLLS